MTKSDEGNSSSSSRKKKKKEKSGSWVTEDNAGKAVHITAASARAAESAAGASEGLATIGQAAPVLQVAAVAFDAYQIGRNVEKDKKRGTTRNTVKKVTTTVATYTGGMGGALAGAAIGSALFPGVGTIVGGILGGVTGGVTGGYGSGIAAETIMDKAEYDTVRIVCEKCQMSFLSRKYATDEVEKYCEKCRELE